MKPKITREMVETFLEERDFAPSTKLTYRAVLTSFRDWLGSRRGLVEGKWGYLELPIEPNFMYNRAVDAVKVGRKWRTKCLLCGEIINDDLIATRDDHNRIVRHLATHPLSGVVEKIRAEESKRELLPGEKPVEVRTLHI